MSLSHLSLSLLQCLNMLYVRLGTSFWTNFLHETPPEPITHLCWRRKRQTCIKSPFMIFTSHFPKCFVLWIKHSCSWSWSYSLRMHTLIYIQITRLLALHPQNLSYAQISESLKTMLQLMELPDQYFLGISQGSCAVLMLSLACGSRPGTILNYICLEWNELIICYLYLFPSLSHCGSRN